MKRLMLFLTMFSSIAFAEDFFSIAPFNFQMATLEGLSKLDHSLKYPEGLLEKFKPEGAVITNKTTSLQNVSFYAKKSYFGFSQTVFVKGTFESQSIEKSCQLNETGYNIDFSFEGSDSIVSDNIDHISVLLCVKLLNAELLSVDVLARIYKSAHYSNFLGSIVKDIIEAQINPLIKALRQDVIAQEIR